MQGDSKHVPLCESPLTEADRIRLVGLLDELAAFLGSPTDWGVGTRMAQLAFDALRVRCLARTAVPADLPAEERRIDAIVEHAARAIGALQADDAIAPELRLSLLAMLGEHCDALMCALIKRVGTAALVQAQSIMAEAAGGDA